MSGPRLGVGIGLPQALPDAPLTPELASRHLEFARTVAVRAEETAYEGGWVAEQIVGTRGRLEPVVLLANIAAVTTRLRLGCSVFILGRRTPVTFAKQLASLDVVSGGRLTVGLGLGGSDEHSPAFGAQPGRRAARFSEAVAVMDRLWRGEPVSLDGDFFRLDGVQIDAGPLQSPRPRLWLGGHAEGALRRAVRLADGWMGAGAATVEAFERQLTGVRRLIEEEGRDPATFATSKRVYVSVDDDAGRAHERAERAGLASSAVTGRPDEVIGRLGELIELGVDHLLLDPVGEHLLHVEALAPLAAVGES